MKDAEQLIIVLWSPGEQHMPDEVLRGLSRHVWDALQRIGREIGCEVELPQRPTRQLSGMDLLEDLFDKMDEWRRRVRKSDPAFAEYNRAREFLSRGLPYTPIETLDRDTQSERIARELRLMATTADHFADFPCKKCIGHDGDWLFDPEPSFEAVRRLYSKATHWQETIGKPGPDPPVGAATEDEYRLELRRLAEWCVSRANPMPPKIEADADKRKSAAHRAKPSNKQKPGAKPISVRGGEQATLYRNIWNLIHEGKSNREIAKLMDEPLKAYLQKHPKKLGGRSRMKNDVIIAARQAVRRKLIKASITN